jgi:hypothetical protein
MVPVCWVLLVSWRERGRRGLGLEIGHPKFARSQFDWPTTKKKKIIGALNMPKNRIMVELPFCPHVKVVIFGFWANLEIKFDGIGCMPTLPSKQNKRRKRLCHHLLV